ncbi:MAG: hypothetical protein AABY83_10100 [Pseudomonadota bacterium]
MNSPEQVPAEEKLARYVFQSNHLRQDGTVKPDAFVPHPKANLSVTRHIGLNEGQLRDIGIHIAVQRQKRLLGRSDINASAFLSQGLRVLSAPVAGNPNHANVEDWPTDKAAQKSIAQQIALIAGKAYLYSG